MAAKLLKSMQQVQIAKDFLTSAPPGEFNEVFNGMSITLLFGFLLNLKVLLHDAVQDERCARANILFILFHYFSYFAT